MADEEEAPDVPQPPPPPPAVIEAPVVARQDSVASTLTEPSESPAATSPPDKGRGTDAYNNRLARAKSGKRLEDDGPAPSLPQIGKLDLSGVESASLPVAGDHAAGGQTLATPRAQSDAALTVRGEPKHKQRCLFKVGPDRLGDGKIKFAWRPKATHIATASTKGGAVQIIIFRRNGTIYNQHTLPSGPGKCTWLEWECKGDCLGILQEGAGIFLWDVPQSEDEPLTVPMSLAPSITQHASFCKWSKAAPQLAIGTQQGKVIIFNKGEAVMQLHEKKGKHGSPVTCGDWLFDNRLGLASGMRVKISQPIAEQGSKWESYSKFRLGGMLSKVPRHIRVAGDPNRLAFTLNYPPFVAVSVGDKYLLTFDTTRVNGAPREAARAARARTLRRSLARARAPCPAPPCLPSPDP